MCNIKLDKVGNAYINLFLLQCRVIIMKNIMSKIKSFLVNEDGAETVEWAIVAAIIAVLAVVVYNGTLNTALNDAIGKISGAIAVLPAVPG